MKYLIVGLGNIGPEYVETRHNIGFDVLDTLAEKEGLTFKPDRYGDVAQYKFKGRDFYLVKPSTYMNLSGKAVRYWLQQLKLEPDNLLVITDDIALPVGKLRLKGKGSDGGHNGLKSINELLGTQAYPRLRFGVGNDFGKGQQVSYVLGRWNDEDIDAVKKGIEKSIEMIQSFGTIGIERTMNFYN